MQKGGKHITPDNIDLLVNIYPFKNTFHDISHLVHRGLKGNMNLFNNIIGNIILFMPLSFFLIRIFNYKKLTSILLTALLLSLWIEVMQYVFLLGVSDVDDVILNVLGAFIASLILIYPKSKIESPKTS